ncbi:MAG: response regulator transcription factor [Cyanobacteria bacterium SZAS LIN-2]|nr:response regulator transcription factor [Cyanobacteria bacterium SZAS LIN-2]MBS2007233.1 response regulator transcription factor [Cyanobacteria bacterium SZAS TMP-1]
MAKILLVDDDDQLLSVLSASLKKDGYLVELCYSKSEAMEYISASSYDLMVFDVTLPDGNGFDLCKEYRAGGGTAPILMLTGKSDERDKELGLDLGADDYLTKPFGFRELSARLRALLRRSAPITPDVMAVGKLTLDTTNKKLFRDGREVHMQPLDYALLEYLVKHPAQLFTQEALLRQVWGTYTESGVEALRAAIKRIRKEIDTEGEPSMIETTHKVGYSFQPAKTVKST